MGFIKCVQTAKYSSLRLVEMEAIIAPEPKRKLTKEERKAKKEAEALRPKRKYVKKADIVKGIRVSHEAVMIKFD